jgi:hypothetical protein
MAKRFGPLAVLIVLLALAIYGLNQRSAYTDFKARREAWHTRCDRYRDQPLVTPEARQCEADLQALVSEAQRRGWTR